MNSIILRAGTRYLVALLLLFSVYMLLRGHNEPGGGFIGGLIGAAGFVLYAYRHAAPAMLARRCACRPTRSLPSGLASRSLAASRGAVRRRVLHRAMAVCRRDGRRQGPAALDRLVFDIGVYLAVFGAILSLVFAMEEEV